MRTPSASPSQRWESSRLKAVRGAGAAPQDMFARHKPNAAEGVNIRRITETRRTRVCIRADATSLSPSFSAAPGHGLLHDALPPHSQNREEVRRLSRAPGREEPPSPPAARWDKTDSDIDASLSPSLYSFQLRRHSAPLASFTAHFCQRLTRLGAEGRHPRTRTPIGPFE